MLPVSDRARDAIRHIEAELSTFVDGAPPALTGVTPALSEVLGVSRTASYGLAPSGDRVGIEWLYQAGVSQRMQDAFETFLATQDHVDWSAYNPVRPEPAQRNVVVDSFEILKMLGLRWEERGRNPLIRDCLSKVGLADDHQLRVLICDGDSLLGWVGGFREAPFGAAERHALERLVPALRRRLTLERQLATATTTRAVLDATLEALVAAAFVTDARGAVLEANAAGRRWLAREGKSGRADLRDAAVGRPSASFDVTPVSATGAAPRRLLVMRPSAEPSNEERVTAAAARFGFTRRQTEVLALLVEGRPTRTIAAILGRSERTVEAHLRAMYEKAQVDNRMELAAVVWRVGGAA